MSLSFIVSVLEEQRMFSDNEHFVSGFRELCEFAAGELLRNGATQKYFSLFSTVKKFEQWAEEKAKTENEENLSRDMAKSEYRELFARVSEIREFFLDVSPVVVVSESGEVHRELLSK